MDVRLPLLAEYRQRGGKALEVKRFLSRILITLAGTLAGAMPGTVLFAEELEPESARPLLTAESVAAFFDAAFHVQQKDHEMVGAVISVVYRRDVLFKRGYGWADLENRVPADADRSLFRIASISKIFVWTAIMQLIEQGRLDLEDDVGTYIDFQIPATFEEPIRIKHLMTHTPGFEEMGTGGAARSIEELLPLRDYLISRMPARVRGPGVHAS